MESTVHGIVKGGVVVPAVFAPCGFRPVITMG